MSAHHTPEARRHSFDDLPRLAEELGIGVMLFSGAAIVVTLLVLILFL